MAHFARKPADEREYLAYLKQERQHQRCAFCLFDTAYEHFVEQAETLWVVRARFPYSYWDSCSIDEHLMIVPKRHISTFAKFNSEESREYFQVMAAYESRGYSVYTRAPHNIIKTYPHVHTHLFKLKAKKNKLTIYVEKPFINIHR